MYPSAIATLVRVTENRITKSTLRLTVSPNIPTATVECSGDHSVRANIDFNLLGTYTLYWQVKFNEHLQLYDTCSVLNIMQGLI